MSLWHWLAGILVFVVFWYASNKVNTVAFTYVDDKLFPKP